jgi:hypothetical protein
VNDEREAGREGAETGREEEKTMWAGVDFDIINDPAEEEEEEEEEGGDDILKGKGEREKEKEREREREETSNLNHTKTF